MTLFERHSMRTVGRCAAALGTAVLAVLAAGCAREPATPEGARAHGEALVRAMSNRLVSVGAFSVETRDTRTNAEGRRALVTTRTFAVRKPDRIAFTATGEQFDLRGWYADGKVTLTSPASKVWARVQGDVDIDGTLDRLAERFEMQMPMADFLYRVPYDSLIAEGMTGGYVGSEAIEGVDCAHVSFADANVEWHLWLPESGEPLPRKYTVTAKKMRGTPTSEVVFLRWDLAAAPADSAFVPQVPEGFERIAVAARDVTPDPAPAPAPAATIPAQEVKQ
jgi:hypothetical protein